MEPRGISQSESSCSLPLQLLLHYNAVASLCYFGMQSFAIIYKYIHFEADTFRTVLTPLAFIVWACAEFVRLWFGASGNLQEKVPQLLAFLLVSVFPQGPCLIYLMSSQGVQLPLDTIASSALLTFLVLELFFSYRLMRTLVTKQTASFIRLVQENSSEQDLGRDE